MNLPLRLPYLFAAFVLFAVDARACSCALGSLEDAIAAADDIALITVRDVDFVETDSASSEAPSAPHTRASRSIAASRAT